MAPGVSSRFVLVRPSNALNIGAAARAMANFGLTDLAVVQPEDGRWRDAQSAIYGTDILARAPMQRLEQAVADCGLIIGTASAHNRAARRTMVTLPALRGWLKRRLPKGGKAAILFGSERNGLENEELDHCHAILRIPTVPDAPSINLGQAVALIAYELSKPGLERSVTELDEDLVEGKQLEGVVETAMFAMARTGVNAHMSESVRRSRIRRGLLKWRMSRADANWLRGILERLLRR
jgi:tRNA/rRNA methyltransferase